MELLWLASQQGFYVAWSKTSNHISFLLNKKVLGAGNREHVILDLHAHVWIIASCLDGSIAGN